MAWASRRTTLKAEDRSYSLFGLFGVYMPMLYGEGGEHAFFRLQQEIIKITNDHSIFAWKGVKEPCGLLATNIEAFEDCHNTVKRSGKVEPFTMTNAGLQIYLSLRPYAIGVYVGLLESSVIRDSPLRHDIAKIFLEKSESDNNYMRISMEQQDFQISKPLSSPWMEDKFTREVPIYIS
ncbi:hypothetical protein F5Y16DRAFT_422071 [Xylariaceae sp. FL0255]|nr:hypothetical protein F5Y16DRAFT_422071 [Xylariaceae sp. FL0255]